ncbi:MAG: DegT/DnrJ/EryC1/StrS family aminotransferase [Deltaproteobacteria bacterium]|nr:DegT/DnrJ/EryC1/StrS family aminotransferase [Deltaproteobacteria bacterium]
MTPERNIPFGRPWITDQDKAAVLEVLNGHILTHGPQGQAFEQEFAALLGGDCHCVTVSSCMAALHLTYFCLGLAPGQEVIVPAMTHVATAHAVEMFGARPVFVDCRPETGNIDPAQIEALISPRTRALSVVHYLGIPCDMDEIAALARGRGLKVVEDCALAVGARLDGRHVGLFGDAGCFSFYPVKHITTAEGGMLVATDPDLARTAAQERAFGVDRKHNERSTPGVYDVTRLGFNSRMSEMQAALGRGQLARMGQILERRRANFSRLKAGLAGLDQVHVLDSPGGRFESSHYCLSVVLKGEAAPRRDEVVQRLNQAGVGTSVYYPHPVPRLTYYRRKYGYKPGDFPQAEAIADRSIALPVGPHLDLSDMDYIARQLEQALQAVRAG